MKIAIINVSSCVTDADAARFAAAIQIAAARDFCPAWAVECPEVAFYAKSATDKPPADAWQLIIADDSDQVGALGYHETTSSGLPIGYAFAKTDIADNTSWTVTASHEFWEMLGDPYINDLVEIDHSDGTIEVRPKENSDACEDDKYAYPVDMGDGKPPVLMSDFVLPAYFQVKSPKGSKFDFKGYITEPLQLLPGGYTLTLLVGAGQQWKQVTARAIPTARFKEMVPGGKEIAEHSRRWRRMQPDSKWQRSTI